MAEIVSPIIKEFDLKEYLANLKDNTIKLEQSPSYNLLLMGELGAGKSSILITCPMPVIIHAFDPGSVNLRAYRKYIDSGDLMVVDYSDKNGYKRWEKDFESMLANNVLDNIGTYCIDSFTTWFRAMKAEIVRRKGRSEGIPYQQDYMILGMNILNTITLAASTKSMFVLTAHMDLDKEEVSGRMIARLKSIPSLKVDLPTLFDEVYVLQVESNLKGESIRKLITQPTSKYVARTRIGGNGVFDVLEEPDIMKLLVKAGLVEE